jgi:hypothetical protein
VRVVVVVAESGPEPSEPLMARAPLQLPEAVQAVALVDVQASVVLPGETTVLGLALRLTVGAAGTGLTVTVVVCAAVPPAPVQVSV